ncbi:hypothetical protein KSS87_016251 [Heliosperma pusillum]|nr:hypothetical protein KSS87_016251 [Heliosperma pusillum]
MDCVTMKERYVDACRRHGILPNINICSLLFMVLLLHFLSDFFNIYNLICLKHICLFWDFLNFIVFVICNCILYH